MLEIQCLSYDAARHIAQASILTGQTGRILSESDDVDWCEVYCPDRVVRIGTLAQTTLVQEGGQ